MKYLTYWDNESPNPKSEILFCAVDLDKENSCDHLRIMTEMSPDSKSSLDLCSCSPLFSPVGSGKTQFCASMVPSKFSRKFQNIPKTSPRKVNMIF